MIVMDAANYWYKWCNEVSDKLTNLEKSLLTLKKQQKRMLYIVALGFVTVIGNGVLLFYK